MKRSKHRILTTHVGSFPRPPELMEMMGAIGRGEPFDARRRDEMVRAAIADVVARQVEHGVDVVNDGEMGKPGFINYANDRLGGFERAPANTKSMWSGTRETKAFPEFYEQEMKTIDRRLRLQCVGPITYKRAPIDEDIRLLTRRSPARPTKRCLCLRYRRRCLRTSSATSSTRPAKSTCSRSPTRCTRNTRSSPTPGAGADRRSGIALLPHAQSRPDDGRMADMGCGAGRGAQPCAARDRAGEGASPHLPRHQHGSAGPRDGVEGSH